MNHGGLCQSITGAKHFPDWAFSPASLCSSCFSNKWQTRNIFLIEKQALEKYFLKFCISIRNVFFFMCFPHVYMYVCYIHATPVGAKEDISLLGTGVPVGCEPPCRCWEVNPGPLEEHPVLLTSKPSLQPLALIIIFLNNLILWKNKINYLHFPNLLQSAMERPSLPFCCDVPSGCWGDRSVESAFCSAGKLWKCTRALLANGRSVLHCSAGCCPRM